MRTYLLVAHNTRKGKGDELDSSHLRIRVPRIFTAADGLTVADLLHFGFDHTASAKVLIERNARHYDSAGYLAHLGIECLLKAWHLHAFEKYQGVHGLEVLWNGLRANAEVHQLSTKDLKTLHVLDNYAELRYPTLNSPLEIGSDDWPNMSALERALLRRMPKALKEVIAGLHWSKKGGRVLMEKPIARRQNAGN